MATGFFDPKKDTQKRLTNPIVSENEVRGVVATSEHPPDRIFYILWGDEVWACDGWKMPVGNGKEAWSIHIMCPICKRNLRLDSLKKPLLIDERGLESAEPIQCAWDGDFGQILCGFKVIFEPPRKPEDKIVTVPIVQPDGRGGTVRIAQQIKIDAVARKV